LARGSPRRRRPNRFRSRGLGLDHHAWVSHTREAAILLIFSGEEGVRRNKITPPTAGRPERKANSPKSMSSDRRMRSRQAKLCGAPSPCTAGGQTVLQRNSQPSQRSPVVCFPARSRGTFGLFNRNRRSGLGFQHRARIPDWQRINLLAEVRWMSAVRRSSMECCS